MPDFAHSSPIVVLSVSVQSVDYAKEVQERLLEANAEVALDVSNETLTARVRLWKQRGARDIYVVRPREAR